MVVDVEDSIFSTCRAIIEKAYYKTMDYSLGGLFNEN